MEKCHVDAGTLDALRADFKAGKHPPTTQRLQSIRSWCARLPNRSRAVRWAAQNQGRRPYAGFQAEKHVEGFWLCFLQEFGPTESVSPRLRVREARLVRFLRSVAGGGVAHLANTGKHWTAAICRTDNGPSTREPHESD
jgi:hypothetical protein